MLFDFASLPLDVMLRICDFLPRPKYNVCLRVNEYSASDTSQGSILSAAAAESTRFLIYRTFDEELDALRDIYRLNSFDESHGKCICSHSQSILLALDQQLISRGCLSLDDQKLYLLELVSSMGANIRIEPSGHRRNQFELRVEDGFFSKRGLAWLHDLYSIGDEGDTGLAALS